MAEGIQLTPVTSRYYCYRCDHEISLLSPTELTCPECSTGFIEEVQQDEYDEDEDSDIDESEINMLNLISVEHLIHRAAELPLYSPVHSDPDSSDEPTHLDEILRDMRESILDDIISSPVLWHTSFGQRNIEDLDGYIAMSLLFNQDDVPGHPPLPASQIKLLPIITVSEEHVVKGIQCTICIEDFAVKEEAKILPCDHFYHEACITPWLRRHGTCPNCRKTVKVAEKQSKNGSQPSESRPLHRSLSSESLNSESSNLASRRLSFTEGRPSSGTIFTTGINPLHHL